MCQGCTPEDLRVQRQLEENSTIGLATITSIHDLLVDSTRDESDLQQKRVLVSLPTGASVRDVSDQFVRYTIEGFTFNDSKRYKINIYYKLNAEELLTDTAFNRKFWTALGTGVSTPTDVYWEIIGDNGVYASNVASSPEFNVSEFFYYFKIGEPRDGYTATAFPTVIDGTSLTGTPTDTELILPSNVSSDVDLHKIHIYNRTDTDIQLVIRDVINNASFIVVPSSSELHYDCPGDTRVIYAGVSYLTTPATTGKVYSNFIGVIYSPPQEFETVLTGSQLNNNWGTSSPSYIYGLSTFLRTTEINSLSFHFIAPSSNILWTSGLTPPSTMNSIFINVTSPATAQRRVAYDKKMEGGFIRIEFISGNTSIYKLSNGAIYNAI